jgi:hypothetical protein
VNDHQLQRQLTAYREATAAAVAPASLADQIVATMPRRARSRLFVRDARAGLLLAGALAVVSGLWAVRQTSETEQALAFQIGAWMEEP